MQQLARDGQLSSAHLLFVDDADRARRRSAPAGCCARACSSTGRRTSAQPYADFADFLASLQRDKRKKIQQERRRSPRPASASRVHEGADIDARRLGLLLPLLHAHLPRPTTRTPYLTRDFFARMARTMAEHWLMFVARARRRAHRRVADRHRPAARHRLRPLLGLHRTRALPALRGLLLPAAGLVHRPRLPALRGRRAGRAQDGARPAAGGDRARRTGCATRASPRRWPTSWPPRAPASTTTWTNCANATRSRRDLISGLITACAVAAQLAMPVRTSARALSGAFPAQHLDPLADFEVLVVLEEVLDGLQPQRVQVFGLLPLACRSTGSCRSAPPAACCRRRPRRPSSACPAAGR